MGQTRREFVGQAMPQLAALLAASHAGWSTKTITNHGPEQWRAAFPALKQTINGRRLIYFDTAATAQRPQTVIDALAGFYSGHNANPSATLHALARRADADFQAARATVAGFINAPDPLEIIWTKGTTEGINLVATAWGSVNLRAGDEVVLTIAEHASCMLPLQLAAKKAGAVLRYTEVDDEGRIQPAVLEKVLSSRTRLVCFTHVSNVTGAVSPAAELCRLSHQAGALVLIDAAQSIPHIPVDVRALGCDFLAFSGHKIMGPMGSGVLWVKRDVLDLMPPYQAGSNAAHGVGLEAADWSHGGLRFGAGTPNVAGAVGLAAAIRFVQAIGFPALIRHEQELTRRALEQLAGHPWLRLLGPSTAQDRICLFSFHAPGRDPTEIMTALDLRGIAIRSGDLASLPLLQRLGAERAARASLYLYNSTDEVDLMSKALASCRPA